MQKGFGVISTETEDCFFFSNEYITKGMELYVWKGHVAPKKGQLPKVNVGFIQANDIIYGFKNYINREEIIFESKIPEGIYQIEDIKSNSYKNLITNKIFRFVPNYKSNRGTPRLENKFIIGGYYKKQEAEAKAKAEEEKITKVRRQCSLRTLVQKEFEIFVQEQIKSLPIGENYFEFYLDNWSDDHYISKIQKPKVNLHYEELYEETDFENLVSTEETKEYLKNLLISFSSNIKEKEKKRFCQNIDIEKSYGFIIDKEKLHYLEQGSEENFIRLY